MDPTTGPDFDAPSEGIHRPHPGEECGAGRWSSVRNGRATSSRALTRARRAGADKKLLSEAVQRLLAKSRLTLLNHPKGGRCLRFVSAEVAQQQVERREAPHIPAVRVCVGWGATS